MPEIDLETLSLKELKSLQVRIDRVIANYEDRRRREALADLEERARALGFTLAELIGIPAPRRLPPPHAEIRQSRQPGGDLVRPWPKAALVHGGHGGRAVARRPPDLTPGRQAAGNRHPGGAGSPPPRPRLPGSLRDPQPRRPGHSAVRACAQRILPVTRA